MAKIKAVKYLGWKFLRIPHNASENEALSWPGGFESAGSGGSDKPLVRNVYFLAPNKGRVVLNGNKSNIYVWAFGKDEEAELKVVEGRYNANMDATQFMINTTWDIESIDVTLQPGPASLGKKDAALTLEVFKRLDKQTIIQLIIDNSINNDASTYDLTSLSSMFSSSRSKLVKIHAEERMPTTGAYTVLSLGWTYTDSENAPALLAVELATGKLYYYQGTEANCTSAAWKEFNFGDATLQSADDYGIRGDYCSKYGVIKIGNSKPDIISSTEILWVGPNIIKMPGTLANPSESLVTLANSINHTIHKTTDFDLVYVHGLDELLECDKVCFSRTKPTEEGTCQVWFNGIEWKFRDVNQGNVWTAARCQPLGRVIFTDGAPTRIDYVGWYHPNMYNA